ncbi:NTP transferase domain-containing protein [Candidatus Saccharibacteria bacterium]|nr:NTP transferase domain-containing protein [Candidatus Saccharibacteria bacterium]
MRLSTVEAMHIPDDIPVVILCGGMGTRMAGATHDSKPKHLLQVNGKTILEYALEPFLSATEIILAVGHHSDQIEAFANRRFGRKVKYSRDVKPTGSMRALSRAVTEHEVAGRFIFANGDDVTPGFAVMPMLADHNESGAELTILATTKIPRVEDFVLTTDALKRATSLRRAGQRLTNIAPKPVSYGIGTFICEQSALSTLDSSPDIEAFMKVMLNSRRLGVHAVELDYFNINQPADLQLFTEAR